MSRARAALVAGNLVIGVGVVATTRRELPDATSAYALLGLATAIAWPLLRRRKLTTLLLASTGAWTMLTGFLLVYLAPGLPQGGGARRWWHAVTGIGMLLAFLAHWARNARRLRDLLRKLLARRALLAGATGGWILLVLLAIASWRPPLRALFDDTGLFALTTGSTVVAATVVLYAGAYATTPGRRRTTDGRDRARGAVDVSLLGAMWLATLTAFPIQYATRSLRAVDAYWFLVGWHVVVSVILVALVAFHIGFNARPLASHALR